MKKYSTIICCICFVLGGFMLASTNNAFRYNKTAAAAPIIMQYPKDLAMGHTNNVGLTIIRDSIHDTIPLEICCVSSKDTVYKTKWRTKKVFVPDTMNHKAIIDIDTIRVSKPVIIMPETKTDSVSL